MYHKVMKLQEFNDLLLDAGEQGVPLISDKFLIQGTPFVFEGDSDKFFDFKQRISDYFGVGTHEIFIVGSSKLGFSYWKQKAFSADSDIDVAIVSEMLFEKYSTIVMEYVYDYRSKVLTHTEQQEKNYRYFLQCLALGFIRPSIFPEIFFSRDPDFKWDSFFRSISSGRSEVGDYDVHGIIYKSYQHLKRYHISGLNSKLKELEVKRYEEK